MARPASLPPLGVLVFSQSARHCISVALVRVAHPLLVALTFRGLPGASGATRVAGLLRPDPLSCRVALFCLCFEDAILFSDLRAGVYWSFAVVQQKCASVSVYVMVLLVAQNQNMKQRHTTTFERFLKLFP